VGTEIDVEGNPLVRATRTRRRRVTTTSPTEGNFLWEALWQRGNRVATLGLILAGLSLFMAWEGGQYTSTAVGSSQVEGDPLYEVDVPGRSAFGNGTALLVVPLLATAVLAYVYRHKENAAYLLYLALACSVAAWLVGATAVAHNLSTADDAVTGVNGTYTPGAALGAWLFCLALLPFVWRAFRVVHPRPPKLGSV
jgi:hypothetical protein